MPGQDGAPGLEYPLLFGLPENKTEILGGKMRLVWPFADSGQTEAAFARWTDELERWRGARRVAATEEYPAWHVGGCEITRYRRYIEILVPMRVNTCGALREGLWRPDLWGLQDSPADPAQYSVFRHGDVRMNLWRTFEEVETKIGGDNCPCDVMVTADTSLYFEGCYFTREAPMELIAGDFAAGVPHVVAQVMTPATLDIDRGPRLQLLHQAGVRHVWLLDPARETLEALAWEAAGYLSTGVYRRDDTFRPEFCPEIPVEVAGLFRDQRWGRFQRSEYETDEAGDAWLIDPERRLGLEHLMLLGHPARRYEIWRDSSPCVLAFASAREARARLRHFLTDAARWRGVAPPAPLQLTGDVETARIGPLHFSRRQNRIHLDVDVDPRVYVAMLEPLADPEVWREPHFDLDEWIRSRGQEGHSSTGR